MRAWARLDDGVCSGWSTVELGLRQRCEVTPLLFDIFFAAVINEAYTRFNADEDIMDARIHLRERMGAGEGGNRWRTSFGDAAMGLALR